MSTFRADLVSRSTALVPLLFLLVTACEQTFAPNSPQPTLRSELLNVMDQRQVGETFDIKRAEISLDVEGALRPGAPIVLRAQSRALRPHGGARITLRADGAMGAVGKGGFARETSHMLPVGQTVQERWTVQYDRPGYYPISAVVRTADVPGSQRSLADTLERDVEYVEAWLLVEDSGGRLDHLYNSAVADSSRHGLEHGALGAFNAVPAARQSVTAAISDIDTFIEVPPRSSMSTSNLMQGRLTYAALDNGSVRTPVSGATVQGWCRKDGLANTHTSTNTDAAGYFTIECAEDEPSFSGGLALQNSTATVFVSPNPTIWLYAGTPSEVWMSANGAGRVWELHNQFNPPAANAFGVSIGSVNISVGTQASDGISRYEFWNNLIKIAYATPFSNAKHREVTHEYGHAFHYLGIDQYQSWICNSDPLQPHNANSEYTPECAFGEGFAIFFAVVALRGEAPGGSINEIQIYEENSNRLLGGNGLLKSGMMAATMLDIADDATWNDGYSGDDDTISGSLALVVHIMKHCRLPRTNGGVMRYSYDFIYCAESDVTAYQGAPSGFQSSWFVYPSLTWDVLPSLPPASGVRSIWRRHLYNL